MKAKEKAKELVCKFLPVVAYEPIISKKAVECALICVEEFLIAYENVKSHPMSVYWNEVKKEIRDL